MGHTEDGYEGGMEEVEVDRERDCESLRECLTPPMSLIVDLQASTV